MSEVAGFTQWLWFHTPDLEHSHLREASGLRQHQASRSRHEQQHGGIHLGGGLQLRMHPRRWPPRAIDIPQPPRLIPRAISTPRA